MGLFTDRCLNPSCDQRVRKGAKFCPKCGAGAPTGRTTCGHCQAEVPTSAKFCSKCGVELAKAATQVVLGDRWSRQPGDFAVRIDAQDIRGPLANAVIVEHGTRALLYQDGKYKGELTEGRYQAGELAGSLLGFKFEFQASVVLMDVGDLAISVENEGLWTADTFVVGTTARLVLRIHQPDTMFVSLFKGRKRVTLDDLERQLSGEVKMLLAGIVARYRVADLFGNAALRDEIEQQLRPATATALDSLGLELVRVEFIAFSGEAYEQVRGMRADLATAGAEFTITEERAKLNQRLAETLTQAKIDTIKSGQALEEFIHQTEHELGLKETIRKDEMDRLRDRFEFERDRESVLRRIAIEGIINSEEREQAWADLLSVERQRDELQQRELARQLEHARNDLEAKRIQIEIEKIEHQEDTRQAEEGLKLLQRTKGLEHESRVREQELEAQKLRDRSQASVEALLSIVGGDEGQRIARLEELRRQQNLTPEQILALAAQASPDAAQALAAKYQADGQVSARVLSSLEQQLSDQRQMAEGYADRMEHLMRTALEQMGGVASTRARPATRAHTVVAPGDMSPPFVIASHSAPTGTKCEHCGEAVDLESQFCPECGKQR